MGIRYGFPVLLTVALCSFSDRVLEAQTTPVPAGISVVAPSPIRLDGPDARHQLLIDGSDSLGRKFDLTPAAQFAVRDPGIVSVSSAGLLTARADGHTEVQVHVAGQILNVAVAVQGTRSERHFNFERDILPILSRYGCNASGCHGKAEGQNGFKLSVFGFDPEADHAALLLESRGRRVNFAQPASSLLLTKASGGMPHGGGVRIPVDSIEYAMIANWIGAGAPLGSVTDPQVISISVTPGERQLTPGQRQQLRVVATYADGQRRDVTTLAQFQTNHPGLAAVDDAGLITAGNVPGDVAIMASFMGQVDVFRGLLPRTGPLPPALEWPQPENFIDQLVDAKLRKLGIVPSGRCSDADYLRRVTLDVIGRLPTVEEARAFLADSAADKRSRLVDRLLEQSEYADLWALRWSDLLRVDRAALGSRGAYDYYRWIRESVAANQPLDQFARDVLLAEGYANDSPAAHFYRVLKEPGERAATVSQVFLGVRIECAQCHHHPFDRWSQADYVGMKSYFTQLAFKSTPRGDLLVANESASELKHPRTNEPIAAYALGEEMPAQSVSGDRRRELAAWMTSAENPWFARNMANRFWAHFTGRGIVEPVDDVRMTNPASNPELLDGLAQALIENDYDARQLIRLIVASRTYQLTVTPNDTNRLDEQNFSRALIRPMAAEVLLDAVCDVTGVPEKFAGVPTGSRAVQLWDSQVTHEFLKKFGRPVRATACECERSVDPSISQALHIMNSPAIQNKLAHAGGRVRRWARQFDDDFKLVETVYLACYSRYPTSEEREAVLDHLQSHADEREQALEDLVWSLMNTSEFLFNH